MPPGFILAIVDLNPTTRATDICAAVVETLSRRGLTAELIDREPNAEILDSLASRIESGLIIALPVPVVLRWASIHLDLQTKMTRLATVIIEDPARPDIPTPPASAPGQPDPNQLQSIDKTAFNHEIRLPVLGPDPGDLVERLVRALELLKIIPAEDQGYSEEEAAAIARHLEALGYL